MGFASDMEVQEFFRSCPEFEQMLIRSGMLLIKYWFSVSDEEQERRFRQRIKNPTKRWKLSPMDLEAQTRWFDYAKAKDEMFTATDTKQSPWLVVQADDKKRARLNCIHDLLTRIPCPYHKLEPVKIKIPKRQKPTGYVRTPFEDQTFVKEVY